MKNLKFIILLFLFSCTSTNEPNRSNNLPTVTITGYIYEQTLNGKIPSVNTNISCFYNDSLFVLKTDNNGKFSFVSNKYSEMLKINITKENYTLIDTTMEIGQLDNKNEINFQFELSLRLIPTKKINIFGNVYQFSNIGKTLSSNTNVHCIYNNEKFNLTTDEKGKFNFNTVYSSDSIRLIINKTDYTLIDTVIVLDENTELDSIKQSFEFTLFYLKSYFPFQIGDKWEYNVKNWGSYDAYWGGSVSEEQWELIEVGADSSYAKYHIKFNHMYDYEAYDTTFVFEKGESDFQINISKDGVLSCKFVNTYGQYFPKFNALLNNLDFYGPNINVFIPYDGDSSKTIEVGINEAYYLKYTLIVGKGISYVNRRYFTGMGYGGWIYTLKN